MTDESPWGVDRRTVLGAIAGAAGALAGCSALERGDDAATTDVADDEARDLAAEFAPTTYFDEAEQWFPTDPRPYEREEGGDAVVDGFAAFDGYTDRFDGESPPDPTVFYNVRQYADSPLAVVQYWFYAAFDQFTTNFHWHDWEVLHVYVDTDTGDPQLYVASSHSRRVPNNEFLDPDRAPRILSELGSHSSALSVNDDADRFQRLSVDGGLADITNSAIEGLKDVSELPLAYGLPRDEGGRLPFVVPELDGAPVYDHDRLPSVDEDDLVPAAQTVRSFDALSSPPQELPERSTGLVFEYVDGDGSESNGGGGSSDDAVAYDLVPTAELEHVTEFTGPQLSFEFALPGAVEDAVASHLTAPGTPWAQPRYDNPAADISDPVHRRTLAERYDAIGEPAPINTVVARISEAVTSPDAPDDEGLETQSSPIETVVMLQSDPVAVPTSGGVTVLQDVPAGEHQLTVNGAGLAPHSETITVDDAAGAESEERATETEQAAEGGAATATTESATETATTEQATATATADDAPAGVTVAGVDGQIPLVARESATKLAVDPDESDDPLTDLAVEDDFAGRLYDAPLSGPDAVYVHRGGAYTAEVRDADAEVGAFRVNPDDESRVALDRPRTGKAPLAEYLADVAEETRAQVAAVLDEKETESGDGDGSQDQGGDGGGPENAVRGLAQALDAIAESARRAAERAEAGDRGQADAKLDNVRSRLQRAIERLEAARGDLPPGLANAADRRFDQVDRRSEQARNAEKL